MFNPECYAKYAHYVSQLDEGVLKKARFQSPLTEDQQVLEVGCGPGHFTRQFLLPYCQPCRRIVAADIDPGMVDFAKENFSHEAIVYDILDITTPNLSPFLERYGKFDRTNGQQYANIAKLLKDQGECLVLAFTRLDDADVWADVCSTPQWKGRIPDPRNLFNASFDFDRVKSATQVESEVRDTLRGTGLQCISFEVDESSWTYDDMDTAVDMLITIIPFKASVPAEEWTEFRNLVTEIMRRKLSTSSGQLPTVKLRFYVVHALKSTPQ
ncbi:hypothetical protein HPB50_002067 [Hyalomma asiaticum]|uniref:Uncharacterized protein n=1 Tax=Hyalomma asiaticum TaxID=266040 RepID=A0ACB7TA22_HYAAI|nr:hypothetical protein HPB50_002067 [Hyalomma asiaticum]